MSYRPAHRARPAAWNRRPSPPVRRRRAGAIVSIIAAALIVWWAVPHLDNAVRSLEYPLTNADVIRAQSAAKHLDPALVAAVIYAETKFDPRTSPTGAEGLMQIEPSTALFLAHLSGGYRFQTSDLASPQVNIAYGTYYLRYLLDHYDGNVMLALAAYNGGLANVDEWTARARARGSQLTIAAIPFPETRDYVQRVLSARQEYRSRYSRQLGLS